MYGPTTGDKIRLGDTNLYAEIERDFAVYGDECVFGGGKVIRDGMGQSSGNQPADSLDSVITNAVIIDYSGIYKADIGVRGGLIVAIGKSGNPDIMNAVHTDMIIGVSSSSQCESNSGSANVYNGKGTYIIHPVKHRYFNIPIISVRFISDMGTQYGPIRIICVWIGTKIIKKQN